MQWQATAMKSGDDEKIEFMTAVPLDGQVEVILFNEYSS
jgi:hypothetical protein